MFKAENIRNLNYKISSNTMWLGAAYSNHSRKTYFRPGFSVFPNKEDDYLSFRDYVLEIYSYDKYKEELAKIIELKNSENIYYIACWNISHGIAFINAIDILEKEIKEKNDSAIDTSNLTECQKKGIEIYLDFLNSDERFLLLTGGGGVGKSFLMGLMIELVENKAIILNPKHKIKKLHKDRDVILNETYQSFFKITPNYSKVDKKGNVVYEIKNTRKTEENISNHIEDCVVIFFEECSMIDSKVYSYIKELIPKSIKIVFVGDNAQIPPIGEDISPSITQTDLKIELKTVVRYSGELLEFCQTIREEILSNSSIFSFHRRKNNNQMIQKLKSSTEALSIFESQYKKGVDIRILCYKNESMESYNKLLNELLFEEQVEDYIYFIGQKIIHNYHSKFFSPRFRPTLIENSKVSYLKNTSNLQKFDEILIQEIEIFNDCLYSKTFDRINYEYFVKSFYLDRDIEKLGGISRFKKLLETNLEFYFLTGTLENGQEIELRALYQNSYEEYFYLIDSFSRRKMYNLKNFLLMLNDWLQPSLSLTIDQSQGSTYEEIILDTEGIENEKQINRYYVGISRAKNKLYLI